MPIGIACVRIQCCTRVMGVGVRIRRLTFSTTCTRGQRSSSFWTQVSAQPSVCGMGYPTLASCWWSILGTTRMFWQQASLIGQRTWTALGRLMHRWSFICTVIRVMTYAAITMTLWCLIEVHDDVRGLCIRIGTPGPCGAIMRLVDVSVRTWPCLLAGVTSRRKRFPWIWYK